MKKKRVNEDKNQNIYYLCGVETFRTPPTGDKFGFPIQPNIPNSSFKDYCVC